MVGMKENRRGKTTQKRTMRVKSRESVYLWQQVQQSLRPQSPWGTEWHSGKGLDPFAGRCLAGRIPQSAGDSSAWLTPLLKCPHCVSGKQERTGSDKTGGVITSLCLTHTGLCHLIQRIMCNSDTYIYTQLDKEAAEAKISWLLLWPPVWVSSQTLDPTLPMMQLHIYSLLCDVDVIL